MHRSARRPEKMKFPVFFWEEIHHQKWSADCRQNMKLVTPATTSIKKHNDKKLGPKNDWTQHVMKWWYFGIEAWVKSEIIKRNRCCDICWAVGRVSAEWCWMEMTNLLTRVISFLHALCIFFCFWLFLAKDTCDFQKNVFFSTFPAEPNVFLPFGRLRIITRNKNLSLKRKIDYRRATLLPMLMAMHATKTKFVWQLDFHRENMNTGKLSAIVKNLATLDCTENKVSAASATFIQLLRLGGTILRHSCSVQ